MRASCIVMNASLLDDLLDLPEAVEGRAIQRFRPRFAVEAPAPFFQEDPGMMRKLFVMP